MGKKEPAWVGETMYKNAFREHNKKMNRNVKINIVGSNDR